MASVNLRGVDLNLLVVLEALLEERHVGRAGLRVGLSQPAVSNALARLRATFGDPLLVRTNTGMEATARARALAAPLRLALRQAERVFTPGAAFAPARCERRFRLRMSDLLGSLFLPKIAAAMAAEAPGAALDVVHLSPTQTVEALVADSCDAALSTGLAHGAAIRGEGLIADRIVCVLRTGHPALRGRFDLAAFLALDHVRVSISPIDRRFVDDALARRGEQRRVALNLPHWLVVPDVLRATDLVAAMPERFAATFAGPGRGLVARDLPFGTEPFEWCLYWHRRHEGDREHAWLRGVLAACVRSAPSRSTC